LEFIISKEIFEKVPNLQVGVLVLANINNKADISKFFDDEMGTIAQGMFAYFDGMELSEYQLIRTWREIFKSFGEKKVRSSVEALMKRVLNGKGLYRINSLVDLYNLASLRFELPCGGEDLNMMSAPLELVIAKGDERFLPLGGIETENPNAGEIIYKSGGLVVCRNFNYRESDITKLTENTKNAIIIFEDALGNTEKLNKALAWIGEKAKILLNAETKKSCILNRNSHTLSF